MKSYVVFYESGPDEWTFAGRFDAPTVDEAIGAAARVSPSDSFMACDTKDTATMRVTERRQVVDLEVVDEG